MPEAVAAASAFLADVFADGDPRVLAAADWLHEHKYDCLDPRPHGYGRFCPSCLELAAGAVAAADAAARSTQ